MIDDLVDDNAADRAVSLARKKYPAANFAAETLVIYPLQRPGAPQLPAGERTAADGSGDPGEQRDEVSAAPHPLPADGTGS